ncbi:sulfotransferase domain-containing protein [Roseomonas sp. CCTCC AB2023176]|uniref:sulfotransferase domain-containing protein n=1 Tax=Roseomonas sp. CCTCC AB2023176 TaxID=3342640 RepID=UPI0035DAF9BC
MSTTIRTKRRAGPADVAAEPPPPQAAAPSNVLPPEAPTREVTIAVGEGRLTFRVAAVAEDQAPPTFSLGVRKSGSTMLHKIVGYLARRSAINVVDVPGTFFRNGFTVADWNKSDLTTVLAPGNVYLGFRSFPTNLTADPTFRDAKKIFMFRDPRDALVSQYFSDAYSHSLPSRETSTGAKAAEAFEKKRAEALATDVETYVVKHARGLDNTLLAFAPMLNDPNCLMLRYEEYVFQKKRLIHKILAHFDWSCPPPQVEALLRQIDEVPESEDKQRFVRRVIPGDHRNKLGPPAIRRLNNILRESMRMYDYY